MTAPKPILKGIDDHSVRQIPYSDSPHSQHTPLLMLMTKRGRVDPCFIGTTEFDRLYDNDSLGVSSPWHTHQSELMRIAIESGNSTVVVKRIVDKDSKTAGVCIGVNPTSQQLTTCPLDDVESKVDADKLHPILEFKCSDPGAWGNHVGLQIFKAPASTQNVMGVALDAVIYEAVIMVEDEISGNLRVLNNLYGEPSTLFTMRPDSIYNNVDYYFDEIMRISYIQETTRLTRPEYFEYFTLYPEVIATLATNPDKFWAEDVLGTLAERGNALFRKNITVFAESGSDGFLDTSLSVVENIIDRARKYEDAVRDWLAGIDDTNPIVDMAQFPYSTIWDSGFIEETKKEFKNLLNYRKDIWIAVAATSMYRYLKNPADDTYSFSGADKLSNQETISMGTYYRSIFMGIPESIEYGTPTVRATLICQDGVNRNTTYRKRQSLNVDLFKKVCNYCGSGDGRWNSKYAFDQPGINHIAGWQDVSMSYISPAVTDNAWDAGLIYVQSLDTNKQFYPAYQTVYPDDTSVLNNVFTMMACCWINKIHHKAWTTVTGNSKHTDLEIAERLDQYINSRLMNAFDGRFITSAKTFYTPNDQANGFSFTTETTIYCNVTKRVANYKIIAHRMSELL